MLNKPTLGWLGFTFAVLGTLSLALGVPLPGFIARLLGDVCWLSFSLYRPYSTPLIVNNTLFFAVDVVGIANSM